MTVLSKKLYSPSEFVEIITGEYYTFSGDNDSVAIRKILADHGYKNIWDYQLDEIEFIYKNQYQVVLVDCMIWSYSDEELVHSYRWFRVPEDAIEKFEND